MVVQRVAFRLSAAHTSVIASICPVSASGGGRVGARHSPHGRLVLIVGLIV